MVNFRFGWIRLPDTRESAFEATSHSTIFDILMRPLVKIKGTNIILPVREGPQLP